MDSTGTLSGYLSILGAHAQRMVELSLGEDPEAIGVLTGGGATFLPDVWRFCSEVPFASAWRRGAQALTAAFPAIRYLFRADFAASGLTAVTLYVRLPNDLEPDGLTTVLADCPPIAWRGPAPGELSAAIGRASPDGLAMRVTAAGDVRTAVYWNLGAPVFAYGRAMLTRLVRTLGWPAERADDVTLAAERLAAPSAPAVLGVDGHDDPARSALKLDVAEVAFGRARPFLSSCGVSPSRLQVLEGHAARLRLPALGYLGVKFGSTGFSGWKSYWSYAPWRGRQEGATRFVVPSADAPRPRLSPSAQWRMPCYQDSSFQ